MKHARHWFFAFFLILCVVIVGWVVTKRAQHQRPVQVSVGYQPIVASAQPAEAIEPARKSNPVATLATASTAKHSAPDGKAHLPPATISIPSVVAEKLNEELHEKPRYDQPDEAIAYYRLKRLPAGEKEIPVERYVAAKAQMDAMPQYSTAHNRFLPSRNELKASRHTEVTAEALGTWTSLGPGNIGGRTRALLIHPTMPNVMYAAGVAGGVWKTTNSGALWQPLTDLMANIAVSCLTFDPSNPNVVYAGTDEGFFNGDAVRGAGIFRTTDGGETWTHLSATGTSDFYYVNDIVISNTNPQHLYAGTRTGVWRSLDGGAATQAQLDTPMGISLDNAGNLLIADAVNHRIRKLNLSAGIITTVAGNGYGSDGDGGPATQAHFNFPTSVAADQNGNLYISDTSNHQVRQVTAAGVIARFAGTGTAGFSADAGQANLTQFSAPGGLTIDAAGNLYIADQGTHRVRKITTDGIITTIAGNGNTQATTDEGGTALSASLQAPAGVGVDGVGNLFIADTNNHRVVVVAAYKSAATVNGASYATQQPIAAEAIVSVFGINLATREQGAMQLPLPTELAGTSVRVRDSLGLERLAPLFYVGKLQLNYQIPAGTAVGYATGTITNGQGEIFTSVANVTGVTPGIFAANQNGSGAAASVLYVTGVNRWTESNATCDANGQNCSPRQIDLNAADEVFLELYGTGLRHNSGLANVSATVGGVSVPVLYANKQPDFVGLDQVNIQLPRSLAGRGEVEIVLTVDGQAAHPVKINLR